MVGNEFQQNLKETSNLQPIINLMNESDFLNTFT